MTVPATVTKSASRAVSVAAILPVLSDHHYSTDYSSRKQNYQ